MEKEINLRKYSKSDLHRMAELRKRFPGGRSSDYYRWKHSDTPYGEPETWLAEHDGKVVAMIGTILRKLKIGNESIFAAELTDTFTDPDYQGRGIYTNLGREVFKGLEKKEIKLIYGLPNEVAYSLWTGIFGFLSPFSINIVSRPINIDRFLALQLKQARKNPLLTLLLKVIAKSVITLLIKPLKIEKDISVKIEKIGSFGKEVEIFWERVKKDYPIAVDRDEKYLNWRYVQCPDRYELYACKKESEIVGFFVMKLDESGSDDMKQMYIIDMVAEDNSQIKKNILAEILRLCQENDVDVVSCYSTHKGTDSDILKEAGFVTPDSPYILKKIVPIGDIPFIIKTILPYPNEPNVMEAKSWFFMYGDSDTQ